MVKSRRMLVGQIGYTSLYINVYHGVSRERLYHLSYLELVPTSVIRFFQKTCELAGTSQIV